MVDPFKETISGASATLVTGCLTCGLGIDFETNPSYTFLVTVEDDDMWIDRYGDRGGNRKLSPAEGPLSASAWLSISIEDVNEPPWVISNSLRTSYAGGHYTVFRVVEGSPVGTVVGSVLEADDQDHKAVCRQQKMPRPDWPVAEEEEGLLCLGGTVSMHIDR